MRLRAEITSDLIYKLVSLLHPCGTDVIMYFSEEMVSFCIPGDASQNQIRVWIGVDVASCFNKYVVESRTQNTISFKTNLAQLVQVINLHTPSIQMYLTGKSDRPYLHFTHRSLDSLKQVEHRIPVIVLMPKAVEQYKEPEWEEPSMKTKFPSMRVIAKWCSNAKAISNHLLITAERDIVTGGIHVGFKVESEIVSVSTLFNDLEIRGDIGTPLDAPLSCSVQVELKKFIKILKVASMQPSVALMYIYDSKMLRLHFETPCGQEMASMTYVLNSTRA